MFRPTTLTLPKFQLQFFGNFRLQRLAARAGGPGGGASKQKPLSRQLGFIVGASRSVQVVSSDQLVEGQFFPNSEARGLLP